MKSQKKQSKKKPEAPKHRIKSNEQELAVPLYKGTGGKRIYPIG